ncbi:iron ABC transporter permease [Pseudomonas sp. PS1(2021)]|nr:iron ABC transporter permease [Pseudomonas sp. PS1(2021)]UCM29511.1 iron ABC transporter permease [Pseudomonas sp. PS1(2021)]
MLSLCVASLLLGAGDASVGQSLQALLGAADADTYFVVGVLRRARTELALLVGMALGAAGLLLQTVTRNPLAEPGMLGVSAGSAFAVTMSINLGATAAGLHVGIAVLGALGGSLLVLGVSKLNQIGHDPVRLVLAGVAFSGLLSALSSLFLLWDQRTADEMRFWVVGSLAGRPAHTLPWTVAGLLAGFALALPLLRPLAALALGDNVAKGLGHYPQRVRLLALLAVALLVGTANAAAGPIAFLGLIVPFIARRLIGNDLRSGFVLCLLLGPCTLLLADILARLLVQPYELPVGVMTALFGAPTLIAVVRSQRLPVLHQ